jgi:hypothetical protein
MNPNSNKEMNMEAPVSAITSRKTIHTTGNNQKATK